MATAGLKGGTTGTEIQIGGTTYATLRTDGMAIPAATAAGDAVRLDQQQVPFRNRIINGDMQVSQVNASTSVTVTAAAALQYVLDQWYAYCTGANVTGQRVAGSAAGEQYRYQLTGAASVTKIGFAQRIEQSASYDMASQSAMVSVYLSNSLLTTVTWTAWYANTADTFGTLASPTRTQIGTGSITVSGTYTKYNIPITMPAGANTGVEIEFSVGAQTSGTFIIGRAQWEVVATGATTGTAFEFLPYAEQLRRCQRYLPYFPAGIFGTGVVWTTASAMLSFVYPVQCRLAPTGVLSNGTATDYKILTGGTITTCNAVPTFNNSGVAAGQILFNTAATMTVGQGAIGSWNNTPYLYFTGAQL